MMQRRPIYHDETFLFAIQIYLTLFEMQPWKDLYNAIIYSKSAVVF